MVDRVERVILEAITAQYDAAMARSGATTALTNSHVGNFVRGLKTADASGKGIISTLSGMSAGTLAVGAGAAVAAVGIIKMGIDGVRAYVNLATEVRGFQRVSGETAEDSSRMVAALHAVGMEAHVGSAAMFRLSQNIEKHGDVLEADGVTVQRNAAGNVKLLDTLLSVSDAYRANEDPAERNKLVMDAFGRSGVALLPILAAGRERLQEFWAAAERHHEILSDDDLQKARDLKYATHELSEAWGSFERQLGQDAVPLVTGAVHFLTMELDGTQKIADFLGRGLGDLTGIHLHHASQAKADAEAVADLEQSMKDAAQSAADYKRSIDALLAGTFGVANAQDKFNSDLIDFADSVRAAELSGDSYARSLDDTTATGLANRQMLQGLVEDIVATAEAARSAAAQQGQSAEDQDRAVVDATASQRLQLGHVIEQLGLNSAAASQYTDVLNNIDGLTASSTIGLEDDVARAKLDDFIKRTADIPRFIASTIVLDARFVKENEGVPSGIASPALLDARDRISDYLAGKDSTTPGLDQALAGQGPKATSGSSSGGDSAAYLQSLWEQRMEQVANRFHDGKATLEEYQRSLDEQLAREAPWTDRWVALQEKKAAAAVYWSDMSMKYLQALATKQADIEDNMYRVNALSTEQYEDILRRRLASLEMYSDEWTRIMQELQQLEGDVLDKQLDLIRAFDEGLQFQKAKDAAQQTLLLTNAYLTATPTAPSTTNYYGATWSPTFQSYGADSQQATDTNSQKLRDFVASMG